MRWRRFKVPAEASALDASQQAQLKAMILERIIDEALLLQEARRLKIAPSEDDISLAFSAIQKDYPSTMAFNEEVLKEMLTTRRLREEVARRLTVELLFSREAHAKASVSEEEIVAYHGRHEKEFQRPEQVDISMIVVKTADEAARLRERLLRGEPFEVLAKTYSISPEAQNGGRLGLFAEGVMPPVFDRVCFSMKTGQISGVVESDYGYHIFKVLARVPAHSLSLGEAHVQIENALLVERRRNTEQQLLARLRNSARITRDLQTLEKVH